MDAIFDLVSIALMGRVDLPCKGQVYSTSL